jgi:LysM repeat protein
MIIKMKKVENQQPDYPRKSLRRTIQGIFCGLFFCTSLLPGVVSGAKKPTQASVSGQASSAYDVIAAVNALRAARGLPAYEANGALMAAAQAHSEYQASIDTATHSGAGGSSVKERAAAAGYAGGLVVENIAAGNNMTAQQAVNIWMGDNLHLSTMISARADEAGVGVALAGNTVYYTLDVGSSGNAPAVSSSSGSEGTESTVLSTARPAQATFAPITTSTPNADGSVMHVVQPGQALWSIAISYNVKLAELYALNNMTEKSVIFPGQKVVVQRAQPSATPTLAPSETPPPPTASPIPSITMTPAPTETPTPTPTATSAPLFSLGDRPDPFLVVIGAMVLIGAVLMGMGLVLRRGGQG